MAPQERKRLIGTDGAGEAAWTPVRSAPRPCRVGLPHLSLSRLQPGRLRGTMREGRGRLVFCLIYWSWECTQYLVQIKIWCE